MRLISVLIILLLMFPFFSIFGESLPDYEPYEEKEFPKWARDLRRGEIIFFGTIPFTFFISSFSFDLYRYASNNFDPDLAPVLLGNTTPIILTNNEKLQIITFSVSFSFILSVLDYLLGKPWNE
ncbi:MAG: hypothetical protein PF693_09790 [Spirochaetia bacterium]|jgi:hypothetical protein|nr:hypothetical protein [Spirochaetia bacterium]